MTNLTEKDVDVLTQILTGEEIACKKARVYSKTLTDAALAMQMERVANEHAARFQALYSILNGGKA